MLALVTVIYITNPSVSSLTKRRWTRRRSRPALRRFRSMWQDRVALSDDTPSSQHSHSHMCVPLLLTVQNCVFQHCVEVNWSFQESSKEKKYAKCCKGNPDIGNIMLVRGNSQYPNWKMESVSEGLLRVWILLQSRDST